MNNAKELIEEKLTEGVGPAVSKMNQIIAILTKASRQVDDLSRRLAYNLHGQDVITDILSRSDRGGNPEAERAQLKKAQKEVEGMKKAVESTISTVNKAYRTIKKVDSFL